MGVINIYVDSSENVEQPQDSYCDDGDGDNDKEEEMEDPDEESDVSEEDEGQDTKPRKQVTSYNELSPEYQSIMLSSFNANPRPSVLDIIQLSQKVGLPTNAITVST